MENDRYISLICELIRMRPVSKDAEAVNKVQNRVCEFLKQNGIHCAMEKIGERNTLYASTRPGKKQKLLLCVHLDVVPAENEQQYEPEIRDGFLYGRGSQDCLGNSLAAIKALCSAGEDASIGCIFTADEEIGGHTTLEMVERGYGATRMGLVMDSSGGIIYGQKGILALKLTAFGQDGHASAPWAFDNPIIKLVNGFARLQKEWQNPADHNDWRISMAPTVLSAGNVVNRIPDKAEMLLDIRIVSADEKDKTINFIREVTGLDVTVIKGNDPFESPVDTVEMNHLKTAYTEAFGGQPETRRMSGATDARHLWKIGHPVYIIGVKGTGCHASNESLDISSVDKVMNTVLKLSNLLHAD